MVCYAVRPSSYAVQLATRFLPLPLLNSPQAMAGKARRSIARQDFAPVLNLFPLVSHLMAMRGDFERSLQGCEPSVRNRISGIIDVLHQTVSGWDTREW